MTNVLPSFTALTDDQLLATLKTLAHRERQSTAALIAALAELDARRLYLGEGCASLFAYCTQVLHLSEDAAYNRIRCARAAAKWPVILDMIADGSLTVTTVRLLSDVLTNANHGDLLRSACHKSKRDVEVLVATVNPQPPNPPSIRKMPEPSAPRTPSTVSPSTLTPFPEATTAPPCTWRKPRSDERLGHVVPFADGGETTVANVQLRCRGTMIVPTGSGTGKLRR